jgi:hypothetical protein
MATAVNCKEPKGFKLMAVLGVASNSAYLIFCSILVLWNLVQQQEMHVPEVLRANALTFQSSLVYIPISIAGIIISKRLLKRKGKALTQLKYLILVTITTDLATGISEARYSLDGSQSASADLFVTAAEILVNGLIWAYWERDVIYRFMETSK